MAGPERAIGLAVVNLGADRDAEAGKDYELVPASSKVLRSLTYPQATQRRRLGIDLLKFYADDLPDFGNRNEGLFKLAISTQDPQNANGGSYEAEFSTDFEVRDGSYAPSFLYRGVVRNIIFRESVNLRFDLFEKDGNLKDAYDKMRKVIDGAPDLKQVDVLKGIPYLNVATQLFGGIVDVFGKNADDHVWGEFPILELDPGPGGAFLRTGIYVAYELNARRNQPVKLGSLKYRDEQLHMTPASPLPNHVIFGIKLLDYVESVPAPALSQPPTGQGHALML